MSIHIPGVSNVPSNLPPYPYLPSRPITMPLSTEARAYQILCDAIAELRQEIKELKAELSSIKSRTATSYTTKKKKKRKS